MLSTHENPLLLALPESVGQKWEAWHDRWLGKQVRSFGWTQLFAYLFADGTRQRWNRRYWRAFRPRRENPQRKSFDRFQGIYLAREIFSREMGRGARLFRILSAFPVFCLDWFLFETLFFFSTSIELVYRVWTMFGIVVKEIYFLFSFFFLRDEELRKEIILSSSCTFSFILRFLLWEFNSINFFNEILIFDHISCICCFVEC